MEVEEVRRVEGIGEESSVVERGRRRRSGGGGRRSEGVSSRGELGGCEERGWDGRSEGDG